MMHTSIDKIFSAESVRMIDHASE
eukprot:COSAG02_NODE_32114_length_522_cov_0.735225_1_plen_23_part_10